MKVYLELPNNSRGLKRVYDALIKYKPDSVEVTKNADEADLTILHINGRWEHNWRRVQHLRDAGKEYAMIQYCLRSTMKPNTSHWLYMWENARCTWSYYDLPQLAKDDGYEYQSENFYYAPLGVDATVFRERQAFTRGNYTILVHSQSYLTESLKECYRASIAVGGNTLHIGDSMNKDGMLSIKDITDEEMASLYSQCYFVSGLRRIEGFEQPVIEGLLCGARPIVFDRPEMRKWFNEFAVFIPELSREDTVDILIDLFRNKDKVLPITEHEKALAIERFDWSIIVGNFWKKVL